MFIKLQTRPVDLEEQIKALAPWGQYYKFDYADAKACLAKKGTLIISDQNGVHGAHPQMQGKERMLIMMNLSSAKIVPR